MVDKYSKLIFQNERNIETLVNPEEFNADIKYNESLREFLSPTLQQNEVQKVKKFRKKIKIYAQVLGIKSPQEK